LQARFNVTRLGRNVTVLLGKLDPQTVNEPQERAIADLPVFVIALFHVVR
jgi:hypothetical protein